MSFSASLFIDNTERPILSSKIKLFQGVNASLKPCSLPDGGYIKLVLSGSHNDLLQWMLDPGMMKKGLIRYYSRDGLSKTEDLEFWDCHCVGYNEGFTQFDSSPSTTEIVLSPGIFRFRGAVLEKEWKVTDLSQETEPVTNQNEIREKPQIVNCHMEDETGAVIKRAVREQTVFIVVNTKDMVGKKMDIDLSDTEIDFEHNGKRLENDILQDYAITSNLMKIELKAIKRR